MGLISHDPPALMHFLYYSSES